LYLFKKTLVLQGAKGNPVGKNVWRKQEKTNSKAFQKGRGGGTIRREKKGGLNCLGELNKRGWTGSKKRREKHFQGGDFTLLTKKENPPKGGKGVLF